MNLYCKCVVACAALWPAVMTAQSSSAPILEFRTNAYELLGSENTFHIVLGAIEPATYEIDMGFGRQAVEVGQTQLDSSEDSGVKGTAIPCKVNQAGKVRIYGDASNLDYVNMSGCYATSTDFSQLPNLQILYVEHNELQGLDLSANHALQVLYCSDNTFAATGLLVGSDHPDLTILDMGRIEKMAPGFNLSDYPNLQSFDAWANMGLTSLDPTGCPQLLRLSIDSCPVGSLDISGNEELKVLNISDSGVGQLDLTNNTKLTQLYCQHLSDHLNTNSKLGTLDVSMLPDLEILYCGGNNLTSLDVTHNPKLTTLGAQNNLLSAIDLSQNPNLLSVSLQYNCFGFATLPMDPGYWSEYYYYQNPVGMERSYPKGHNFDFASTMLREGTVTDATVYKSQPLNPEGDTPLSSGAYTWDNGVVTINQAPSDSLYIVFSNNAFTEYTLQTSKFMVKGDADYGKPLKAVTINANLDEGSPVAMALGVRGASAEAPKTLLVDWGDGVQEEVTVTAPLPADANVAGTRKGAANLAVYVPEGSDLTAFGLADIPLYGLSVKNAITLEALRVNNAGLKSLDLAYNNHLVDLDLTGNNFGDRFTLAGANGAYGKNVLRRLVLTNDGLTALPIDQTYSILYLDLSNNQLPEWIPLKDLDNASFIDISNNLMEQANLLNCNSLKNFNCANNHISIIQMPETGLIDTLDIRGNNYTFANLPEGIAPVEYLYAPQRPIAIPSKGPGVNLSAQDVTLNGNSTTFTWRKTADGQPLVEGVDFTNDKGKFRFINTDCGPVVCEMTNGAYPEFSGDNALKTTEILPAPMPTNAVASFTTVDDQFATLTMAANVSGSSVLIDWSGDGVELEIYPLEETYTVFETRTYAGVNVKVYVYEDHNILKTFALEGATLKDVDLSALTGTETISILSADIDSIALPADKTALRELSLSNNRFSQLDLDGYDNLYLLRLNGNRFQDIDLSAHPALRNLSLADNQLTDVTFPDNSQIWDLDLNNNQFEYIDLLPLQELEQAFLAYNLLTNIDVEGLNRLRWLAIGHNNFTFATLPLIDNPILTLLYGNQNPMEAQCVEGKVNLSDQDDIDGFATTYRWFLGVPQFDEDGNLQGDELTEGVDFTLNKGVTSFLVTPSKKAMCVMTNQRFPDLYLYTDLLTVTAIPGSVGNVGADTLGFRAVVENHAIEVEGATSPTVELYAADGKLVGRAVVKDGRATFGNLAGGLYILRSGSQARKLAVR